MNRIASNELKAFLQDWLDWAEGRESKYKYNEHKGLCVSAAVFDDCLILMEELDDIFTHNCFPFGVNEYSIRRRNNTQHQDPNRLAWVRAALNDTLDTWELVE